MNPDYYGLIEMALSFGVLSMSNCVYTSFDTIGMPLKSAQLQWFRLIWLALVVYEYRSHGAGGHIKVIQNVDLVIRILLVLGLVGAGVATVIQIGRASCRERV